MPAAATAVTRLGRAGVVEARIWARVSGMSSRLASPRSSWSVNSPRRVSRPIAIGLPIRTRAPVSSWVSIGTDRPMTSASAGTERPSRPSHLRARTSTDSPYSSTCCRLRSAVSSMTPPSSRTLLTSSGHEHPSDRGNGRGFVAHRWGKAARHDVLAPGGTSRCRQPRRRLPHGSRDGRPARSRRGGHPRHHRGRQPGRRAGDLRVRDARARHRQLPHRAADDSRSPRCGWPRRCSARHQERLRLPRPDRRGQQEPVLR